jgi:hypothetical protein
MTQQIKTIPKWLKILLTIVFSLAIIVAVVVVYGTFRWESATREMRVRLEAARAQTQTQVVDFRELEGLPAPVQHFFRTVMKDGQPIIAAVRVEHTGTFNMSETGEQWKPFTSTQHVVTHRPGFVWDARISMMPGLPVHVHDAYLAGEGILHAAVLGLVSMVNQRGTGELAQGELMRFFAETAWYPTALLPSQGVLWSAVDDHSAQATLKDGNLALALLFRFNKDDLIDTVRAEARGRMVAGTTVPVPWQCRFWNYAIRDGIHVPLDGEVAWLLPEGAKPYFRGHIAKINYEFAQ